MSREESAGVREKRKNVYLRYIGTVSIDWGSYRTRAYRAAAAPGGVATPIDTVNYHYYHPQQTVDFPLFWSLLGIFFF